MSSSPTSSSSSEPAAGPQPFEAMLDVLCPVTVILGTGHLTVRECLALQIQGIVPLTEAAGDDLEVLVGDVPVARGEILVVEDATSIRITEIKSPAPIEVSP